MGFRPVIDPFEKPKAQGRFRPVIDPFRKRSAGDDVIGFLSTVNANIPLMDEVADGMQAGVDLATGRAKGVKQAWELARARSKDQREGLKATRPKTAALASGVGIAAQAVPALSVAKAGLAALAVPKALADPAVRQGYLAMLKRKATGPTVQAAVTGGVSGGVAGVASEGDLAERAARGRTEAALGATVGGIMPAAATLAGRGINAVHRATSGQRMAPGVGAVARILEKNDLTRALPDAPGETLPFEQMGPQGMKLARAVAAVPGRGQEIAEATLEARKAAAPMRMLSRLRESLGTEGGDLHEVLRALDAKRKADAAPYFREAEEMGPVDSNALRRLYGRDAVKRALPKARAMASNQDASPDGLVWDVAERWAQDGPQTGAPAPQRDLQFQQAYNVLRRGLKPKVKRGPTLMQFIAENGGLREDGELIARDAELWHRARPFQRKLMQEGGDSLDGWALRAQENGFISPREGERATPDDLMEALNDELAGRPRYNREPEGGELERYVNDLDERFTRMGIDPKQVDAQTAWARMRELEGEDEILQRMADGEDVSPGGPIIESAYTTAPTMKTHLAVKRALDDDVEEWRDPLTGKLALTPARRLVNNTRYDLNAELERLAPSLAEGNRLYSGPSRQIDAVRRGRNAVTRQQDPEIIDGVARVLSEDEKGAFNIGLARGVGDKLRGRNPMSFIRQLDTDQVFRDRLRAGFQDDAALEDFLSAARAEAEAQQNYNKVLTGSRTTPLREIIDDVNASAEDGVGEMLADSAARRIGGETFKAQAARSFMNIMRRARHPALNRPEVSQLLGEVLFQGRPAQEVLARARRQQVITAQEMETLLPLFSSQAALQSTAQ